METTTNKKDPVCGMTVDFESARSSSHHGDEYFFCSESCQRKFEDDPAAVLAKADQREVEKLEESHGEHSCCSHGGEKSKGNEAADSPPSDPDAIYTCPMHPEIEQVGP